MVSKTLLLVACLGACLLVADASSRSLLASSPAPAKTATISTTKPTMTKAAPVVTKTAPMATKTAPMATKTAPVATKTAPVAAAGPRMPAMPVNGTMAVVNGTVAANGTVAGGRVAGPGMSAASTAGLSRWADPPTATGVYSGLQASATGN